VPCIDFAHCQSAETASTSSTWPTALSDINPRRRARCVVPRDRRASGDVLGGGPRSTPMATACRNSWSRSSETSSRAASWPASRASAVATAPSSGWCPFPIRAMASARARVVAYGAPLGTTATAANLDSDLDDEAASPPLSRLGVGRSHAPCLRRWRVGLPALRWPFPLAWPIDDPVVIRAILDSLTLSAGPLDRPPPATLLEPAALVIRARPTLGGCLRRPLCGGASADAALITGPPLSVYHRLTEPLSAL
jgi:hypothetical protein